MADISQKLIARLGANLEGYKKGLRSAVTEARTAGQKMRANFSKAAQGARMLGKAVGLVALALVGIGTLAVREFVQWEEALTGVAKTVDATEEQIRALGQTFVDLSEVIPVSSVELAKLGEVAGQLGVELPNIQKFVEVAAALGVSTNLMAEAAATGLARMSNVMGTALTDVDRLGSTIVDLGNNLATTEREILDMSLRITGAGAQVGLTEAQVLSLSAALSSLGIRSEAGGSAISRVFAEIASSVATGGERLDEFARVAGTSVSNFQRSFKEDAAEAVVAFIAGLKKLSDEGENVFGILEKVEFADIRVRDTLLRAAGGVDTLRKALKLGNVAWEENRALTDEAARFYDRTGARLVALRNKLSNVAAEMGEQLVPIVETVVSTLSGFLDRVRELGPALGEFAKKAADSIPAMAETVVRGVGKIGLALVTAVEFFQNNPIAGGAGLIGLVFMGPTGAAVAGTIGFVIDRLIEKLGGPTTVAEVFTSQLEAANREIREIVNQLSKLEAGGALLPELSVDPGALRARQRELTDEIIRIQELIRNLTSEDFVALGEKGAAAFSNLTDGARVFFTEMADFRAQLGGGGGDEGGLQTVVDDVAEGFDTMRFKFEPLPLLAGKVTANLKTSAELTKDWAGAATDVASTISSGVGRALGDMVTGVQEVSTAIVQLGKTIIRSVISALIQAILKATILRAIFSAFGIPMAAPVPQFASGGIVPGGTGTPVPSVLHGGEVVLSASAVRQLGGPVAANNLNTGSAPSPGPREIAIRMEFPDAGALPQPIDFGVIASNPDIMRLFSAMFQEARFVGTVT